MPRRKSAAPSDGYVGNPGGRKLSMSVLERMSMSTAAAALPRRSAARSRRRLCHKPWRSTISQGFCPRMVAARKESLLSSAVRACSRKLHRPRPTQRPSATEAVR
jgi:hypothetical protein